MNDDFLQQFREPPRPEFARSLYSRIAHEAPHRGRETFRWAVMGLAGAALALVIALAASFAPLAVMARLTRGQPVGRSQTTTLVLDRTIPNVSWVSAATNAPQLRMPAHDHIEQAALGGSLKVRETPLSHHGLWQ